MEKKVWGEYSTYKNPEFIANLSEEDIWKRIDNLGTFLRNVSHNPSILCSKEKLLNSRYNLEYLVYLTRKFGVSFDVIPTESVEVENSESFQTWFSFWYDHFTNMSEEEYARFVDAKSQGMDVTEFLPEKSWNETSRKI